jgi:hypothetical protein
MDMTFEQAEAEHKLPKGSVARKAAPKQPGDLFTVIDTRFALLDDGKVRHMPSGDAAKAAVQEAKLAATLCERIGDHIRILGTQPCTYSEAGVVKPLSDDEWYLFAASVLRGEATFSAATTASRHVVSMMTNELAATHRIFPEDIEPILFSNAPRKPCWARIKVDDAPLETPPEAFAEFLSRVKTEGQRRSLVRWIGSVLDTKSDRSEYLYLRGDGNDGKSALVAALDSTLDPASTVLRTDTLKNDHGSTALEGKRLVIFNEENAGGFAKSATIKRLTGDDAHLINPKNAALRKALFQCKVIYVSNFEPSIHGLRADVRRLAYVEINEYKGIDTTFKDRLFEQAGDMLRYCWTEYQKWKADNPRGGKLGDPAALTPVIGDSTLSHAEDIFNRLFNVTGNEDDYVMAVEAGQKIKDRTKGDFALLSAVRKLLITRVGAATNKTLRVREAQNGNPAVYKSFKCYKGLQEATDSVLTSGNSKDSPDEISTDEK